MHWLAMIHQGGWAAGLIGFGLIIAVSFVPVLPIPMIAAAVGAVLPLGCAVVVTWSAATVGAWLKFFGVRFLFQKHALTMVQRYQRVAQVARLFERNAFLAILVLRLIPIFPSSIINVAAAVTRTPISTFTIATAVGKLPTMLVFTMAGNQLHAHGWTTVIIVAAYVLVITLLTWYVHRKWFRTNSATLDKTV